MTSKQMQSQKRHNMVFTHDDIVTVLHQNASHRLLYNRQAKSHAVRARWSWPGVLTSYYFSTRQNRERLDRVTGQI